MNFTSAWIDVSTLHMMKQFVIDRQHLDGAIIEFGCWEGRSITYLADATNETVHAVDHWQGNAGNFTSDIAKERDVYAAFLENTQEFKNVMPHKESTEAFMAKWTKPIKFLHLDADHNYLPLKEQIEWALPLMVSGGVLCGDDYSEKWPGVMQAVDELLPNREIHSAMWIHNVG